MSNMDDQRPTVSQIDGGLKIESPAFGAGKWSVQPLDDKRMLLVSDEGTAGMAGRDAGLARCPVEVFKDFLWGLHHAGWSGVVSVDTGYGVKKVFFARGDIVFAASNIMDDRLGEVIFREAKISIDELTDSAAQVTKSRKFGQVLLMGNIFSNVELWQALKLQVKQILRSLFMVDHVYFEMQPGQGLAPTEVIFQETVEDLLGECYSFGCAYRAFLGRLRAESEAVLLVPKEKLSREYKPGTFAGDLLGMISDKPNVQELLNTSKLIDSYTIAALANLVNLGLCSIKPDVDGDKRPAPFMAPLKAKFDAYSYVLSQVKKAFVEGGKEFPVKDVITFASSLNPEGFPSLFVDTQGNLTRDCIAGVFSQCSANHARVSYFAVRVESLIQFLLQLAGDNLAFAAAKQIRQEYRSIAT